MSEAEVAILDAGVRQWEDHGGPVLDAIIPAVNRILAARLAAVEALIDDVGETFTVQTPDTRFGRSRVIRVSLVRAALHSDPSEATT